VRWGRSIALVGVVFAVICASAVAQPEHSVVFPEGFTRAQMIERIGWVVTHAGEKVALSPAAYDEASRHDVVPCFGKGLQKNMEGYLFPATYQFDVRTLGSNIVANQISAFCTQWARLDLSYAKSRNLTPYDVLKIASMVEAEAALPDDRPKIAAVIYNRLRLRIPLGIDATLRYGLHIPPTQSITQKQLASDNPYNTRKFPGLPPTPISNPGWLSLRAAAHPVTAGWLYYARVPGTNEQKFFESFAAYQKFLEANGYGPHP
jgi:uncharacterized YceG family protein